MDCIIIDDDATARLIIKQFCLKSERINVLEEFSSAIDAIKYLNNNSNIDLIYLDIHMPTFSGFDFIKTLNNPPKIILTTSDKNLALEAFEYKSVVDYLVKPITFERYNKSLEKLDVLPTKDETTLNDINKSEYIYVNVDRRLVKVNIASIYLIEAKGDYINIKTNKKNYIVHSTLKKIQDKLPFNMFFKVHRSFIINFSEIIDIEDNSVLVRQDVVPVSRSNKSELMKKLNLL
jgi:DNA-binding LytR/AlgR family response regulator